MTTEEIIALGAMVGGGVVGFLQIPLIREWWNTRGADKRVNAVNLTEEIRAHADTRAHLGQKLGERDRKIAVLEARVVELENVNRQQADQLQSAAFDREKSRVEMANNHTREMDALTFALRRVLEESERNNR